MKKRRLSDIPLNGVKTLRIAQIMRYIIFLLEKNKFLDINELCRLINAHPRQIKYAIKKLLYIRVIKSKRDLTHAQRHIYMLYSRKIYYKMGEKKIC